MSINSDLNGMDDKIQRMKELAMELNENADDFPAVKRNTSRILASIRMLEINVSDMLGV
jgi:hypothetical protein